MPKRDNISMSVIRRLPRYYRFLSELKDNGVVRISSRELSDKMGFTASQIRQDLNCFGGFGQQGYGYIVEQLYNEIGNILGLSNRFNAILIGAGNLGRAVSTHMSFESRGFTLTAIFDSNESLIGKSGSCMQGPYSRYGDPMYPPGFCGRFSGSALSSGY